MYISNKNVYFSGVGFQQICLCYVKLSFLFEIQFNWQFPTIPKIYQNIFLIIIDNISNVFLDNFSKVYTIFMIIFKINQSSVHAVKHVLLIFSSTWTIPHMFQTSKCHFESIRKDVVFRCKAWKCHFFISNCE